MEMPGGILPLEDATVHVHIKPNSRGQNGSLVILEQRCAGNCHAQRLFAPDQIQGSEEQARQHAGRHHECGAVRVKVQQML